MKKYLLLLLLPLLALNLWAQVEIEAPEPYAVVTDKNGEVTELAAGDEFSGEAPLVIRLYAAAEEVDPLIVQFNSVQFSRSVVSNSL